MVCLQLSCGQRINCGVNDGNQRTENHRTKVKAAGCVINLTIDNCTCSSGKNHVAEHHICFPVGECTNTAASAIQHNIVDQHYNNRSESVAKHADQKVFAFAHVFKAVAAVHCKRVDAPVQDKERSVAKGYTQMIPVHCSHGQINKTEINLEEVICKPDNAAAGQDNGNSQKNDAANISQAQLLFLEIANP